MNGHEFESRIEAFELAWRTGTPPSIVDALQAAATSPDAEQRRLLEEFVCIDLECRWRSDRIDLRWTLDDYARQFPQLGSENDWPLELIGEELRARLTAGERLASFSLRFGSRGGEIARLAASIERELLVESSLEPGRLTDGRTSSSSRLHGTQWTAPELTADFAQLTLKRLIGVGCMGKVYLARDELQDRDVAVKFLRKSFLDDHLAVRRFLSEAATIARLRHPRIVSLHALGSTPGGGLFYSMDLSTNGSLADWLKRGRVSVARAIGWVRQTCEALAFAHSHGVVHCNLKPANILLDAEFNARLTDFGLSRDLSSSRERRGMEGTAAYMAPEQADPSWGAVDERTDVFGLGAVLYCLLAGRPPWPGKTLPDVLACVVAGTPVEPLTSIRGDLPKNLAQACHRCLAKRQDERFQSANDVMSALAALEAGVPSC